MFSLLRDGIRVCGFIHDEQLELIPDGADYTVSVRQVQQILADAMQLRSGSALGRSLGNRPTRKPGSLKSAAAPLGRSPKRSR